MAADNSNDTSPTPVQRSFYNDVFKRKFRLWIVLYLFILPTVGTLLVFNYYPNLDAITKAFFRWNPPSVLEFVGFKNFRDAFSDALFWKSFSLVGILLAFNFIKLIPGILAAIALHRLRNNRLRYFFQVMFVVPMIIPSMVWLLVWKSFYDPEFGLLNQSLKATGLMGALDWMDGAMPALASGLSPIFTFGLDPVFGSVAGLILFGAMIMTMGFFPQYGPERKSSLGLIALLSLVIPIGTILLPSGLSIPFIAVAGILIIYRLNKLILDKWVIWFFLCVAGTLVFWGELWRFPIYVVAALAIFEWIRRKNDFFTGGPKLRWIGLGVTVVGVALVIFGKIWTEPTEQFALSAPAWIGHPDLVVPALIFWGFPWVGTVGVLIYLSGLQNISEDVYEAAELDGVTPLGMITRIELPLIMTQVRINIIFMTIGTLTMYEMFFILLGVDGGPDNRGMVPGLYMFREAFNEGRFGYACALGMVLFVIILFLTVIYQKYVKVEK